MAANVTVPNNFVAGTPAVADDVDANFQSILDWINANAVHLDASKAFTAIPSGPASDPTNANHLARKAYVDAGARGFVAMSTATANQTGITTLTDLTNMSVTWTATSTRRYKVTVRTNLASTVANDFAYLHIANGANTQLQLAGALCPSNAFVVGVSAEVVLSGLSGSQTVKARLERVSGTGGLLNVAASVYPAFILVEDIGPA